MSLIYKFIIQYTGGPNGSRGPYNIQFNVVCLLILSIYYISYTKEIF